MSDDLNDLTTFTDRNWNGWHPDRPDTAKLEPRTPGNDHEFYLTNASDAVHEMGISKSYSFIKGTEYTVIFEYRTLSETDIIVLAGGLEQAYGPHPPSPGWTRLTVPLPYVKKDGGTHPISIRLWSRSAGSEPHRYDLDNILVRSIPD